MKKIRIVSIVLLILCFALLLCSCNAIKDNFSKKNYTDPGTNYFTTAKMLGEYYDYNLLSNNEQLAVFSKEYTTIVYDCEKDKEVAIFVNTTVNPIVNYNVTLYSVRPFGSEDKVPCYVVSKTITDTTETTYEAALYDLNGTEMNKISSKTPIDAVVTTSADFFKFNKNAFRVYKDGKLEKLTNRVDVAAGIPTINGQCGDYYYFADEDIIKVYNKSLDLTFVYEYPDYAQDKTSFFLNNGNVFVQYKVEKLDDDKKYTFTDYNAAGALKKYDLVQEVINVKKGKVKSIKNKYYIGDGINKSSSPETFNGLKKSYENVAQGYEIKDKKIDRTTSNIKILTLNNNGKVGKVINKDLQCIFFAAISSDRIIVIDNEFHQNLYDYSGKKIGDISNSTYTRKFIAGSEKIYNHNLDELYDMKANGYQKDSRVGDNYILTKDDGTKWLFNGTGEPVKIAEATDYISVYTEGGVYCKREYDSTTTTYTYKLYDNNGQALGVTSSTQINKKECEKATLVYYTDADAKTVYYVIK